MTPRENIEEKPTNNLEAYDLYLQAKQLINVVGLWNTDKENLPKAISLLEEATHLDPTFALAYCMMQEAHDVLYFEGIDHTPKRRALGDAAINEAMRLRPDLGEVHLAAAWHLFDCYRDFERARVQIAIAAPVLSNDPELLHCKALIDQAQGRWDKATAGLKEAATLDPRNPELLHNLALIYRCLRRYRDSDRILDRLIELEPDQPVFLEKAMSAFNEKADLKGVRAAYAAVPLSLQDDPDVTMGGVYYAICARDFAAAKEILSKSPTEEFDFNGAVVPRRIVALWLELVQGNHPTMEQFGAAREQLYRKVEADPSNPFLMATLALADVALGRTQESIQEGRRAMEIRPISEDAVGGPHIAVNVAEVYVWANQLDVAFEQLNIVLQTPNNCLTYGQLKTYPGWDGLRRDPRFDKLLAQLAPHE